MKKILCALIALSLLCSAALAFHGSGYPAWDGSSAASSEAVGSFGGENIRLDFDPTPEYSAVMGGLMTACFFAFDEKEDYYIEFFLMLPEDVAAGDVYTENSPAEDSCSVALYEVGKTGEDFFFAGQMQGVAYPEGASFRITIDSVEKSGNSVAVSGSLEAELAFVSGFRDEGADLAIRNAGFHFTLPLSETPGMPAAPEASEKPVVPAFTLPPDHAAV